MRVAKQSTARDTMVFMTDEADHVSGKTGLTLTITASKAGGAFGSISPTVTERGNGWYSLALTTSHTDTLGDLALHITSSGADPTDALVQVVAYDMGDAAALGLSKFAAIETDTQDIQSRLPAALTGDGNIKADALRVNGSATAASNFVIVYATDFSANYDTTNDCWKANTTHFAGSAVSLNANSYPHVSVRNWRDSSVQTSMSLETIATVGTVSTSIGSGAITSSSFASGAITAAAIAADAIGASELAADAVTEIVTGVWQSLIADHDGVAGSFGEKAVDWASQTDLADIATDVDTLGDTAATILGDTNELQTDWANGGRLDLILDARASQTSVDTLAGYVDTEVAAIKSKTDNLPASPAAVGSAMTLSATGLDLVLVDGVALPKALQRIGAVAAGKLPSGAGTSTEAFVGLDGSTTRVTFTVDADGNRTAVTYNDA